MRAKFKTQWLFPAAASLALAIGGCENGAAIDAGESPGAEDQVPNRALTQYEIDVVSLKSRESDPDRIAAGIAELRARHGIAAAPVAPQDQADFPGQDNHALEKGSRLWHYFVPRTLTFGVTPTPDVGISVPAGMTVQAWTTRTAENGHVDPVMVGFYRTSGDVNSNAYKISFIGFADDVNGLDPDISWKNVTGATKVVRFVAFAYSSLTTGEITIHYRITGGNTISKELPLIATRIPKSSPNTDGCTGPKDTQIALVRLAGLASETAALAYNAATKRGGYVYSASAGITLDDVLPTSGTSFLIGYTRANTEGFYDGSTYKARQSDSYTCP